jgi:hypothetical protein
LVSEPVTQLAAHLVSGDVRQVDVQHDQRGLVIPSEGEGVGTAGRLLDGTPDHVEKLCQHPSEVRVVIDNEERGVVIGGS